MAEGQAYVFSTFDRNKDVWSGFRIPVLSHKHRLYPTAAQGAGLDAMLGALCDLYKRGPSAAHRGVPPRAPGKARC